MNPDLHMAAELKNTGKGNLFVVFGEPDIDIVEEDGDRLAVKINGVDVFDPNTGDIRSGDTRSSPLGSSTLTTTKKAFSCATPISSAPTIRTNL